MQSRTALIFGALIVLVVIVGIRMSLTSKSDTDQKVQSVEENGIPLTSLITEMSDNHFPDQKFFLIDHSMIFVERTGYTSDYSYHHILFDAEKHELCSYADNVTGPVKQCTDESKKDLFETITKNLAKPDLGLGTARVELIYEKHPIAE